jgi:alkyl sulfatase BDS1-like metallo-beta-lactamase superfamily hydrolase
MELRHPRPKAVQPRQASGAQMRGLPADLLLDALSVRLNGPAAGTAALAMTLVFADRGEAFAVRVENAALHHRAVRPSQGPAPAIELTGETLADLALGQLTLAEALAAGRVRAPHGAGPLEALIDLLDRFDFWFEIAAP